MSRHTVSLAATFIAAIAFAGSAAADDSRAKRVDTDFQSVAVVASAGTAHKIIGTGAHKIIGTGAH